MNCPERGSMNFSEKIKEILKKCWGLYPLALVLLCTAMVMAVERMTGDSLRYIPSMILTWMQVGSVGIALLWANVRIIKSDFFATFLKFITPVLCCIFFGFVVFCNVILMPFSYRQEYTIVHNGTKMVASVDDYLHVSISYYEYKNPLFYGEYIHHQRISYWNKEDIWLDFP